jgi:RNA polymerase sigma-70 factor (ECF subfamily)
MKFGALGQAERRWLIEQEIPHLRRYARALAKDPAAADDLVQDSLERAMRKWHLWLGRGSLRGWLFRLMYNVYLNDRVRRQRQDREEPMEWSETSFVHAPDQETRIEILQVMAAIDRLPDDQREALLLVALENMSYREAAYVLGIPTGTLRSRLSRGRETLRQQMQLEQDMRPSLRRVK